MGKFQYLRTYPLFTPSNAFFKHFPKEFLEKKDTSILYFFMIYSNLVVIVTFRRACKKSGVGALWKFTVRHLQNLKGPKLFWSIVNSPMRDIRLIFAIFGGHKGPKNMAIGPNFPCHTYVTICITKAKGILEWQRSSY